MSALESLELPCGIVGCDRRAEFGCDRRVLKPVKARVRELEIGNTIFRASRPERTARVCRIQFGLFKSSRLLQVLVLPNRWNAAPKLFRWDADALVGCFRNLACGLGVCEAHVRELDDNYHVCSVHWSDFDTFAATDSPASESIFAGKRSRLPNAIV